MPQMPAHWTVILGPFGVLATVTGSGPEGSELMIELLLLVPETDRALSVVHIPVTSPAYACYRYE